MSADNGVYILETVGPEYRVVHAQGIDNIYGKFNDDTYHWDGDDEMIREYFGTAPVFQNLEEALDKASDIAYDIDYLEYGICVINDFKHKVFSEL
jgi:hypothetical protein